MSTNGVRIVRPLQITPAMVLATNVPEDDYPPWSGATTYAAGARCIKASQVWESVTDSNVGNNPESSPLQWVRIGPVNRYKAFDASVSSKTARAGSITYQLRPGVAINALAALNIAGATAMRVYVVNSTYGVVYDRTISLARVPIVGGWWAWMFGERRAPSQAIFEDIPSIPASDVHIEITGTSALSVGVILVGQARSFSMGVEYGARVGINDYSRKERDEFGNVVVVERAFAKRANLSMMLRSQELDSLQRLLSEIRAVPCLWIGTDLYESTVVYGFYKSFDMVISYPEYADCDLELEGLT